MKLRGDRGNGEENKEPPYSKYHKAIRDFACMKHDQEAKNEKEHMEVKCNCQNKEVTGSEEGVNKQKIE